jgi:hypothetical protein
MGVRNSFSDEDFSALADEVAQMRTAQTQNRNLMIDLAALTNLRDAEQYSDIALYVQVREQLEQTNIVRSVPDGAIWASWAHEPADRLYSEKGVNQMITNAKSQREKEVTLHWMKVVERTKLECAASAPERKLREVKFSDGYTFRVRDGVLQCRRQSGMWHSAGYLAPADAEAYLALCADPYEPAVDVRAAVREIVYQVSRKPFNNSEVDAVVNDIMNLFAPERAS